MSDLEAIEAELRAGLEGVTKGPWERSGGLIGTMIDGRYAWTHVATAEFNPEGEANAAHIALCSPENIRALLDKAARTTALEADVALLTAERDTARATNARLHRRTQVAEGFHQGCLDYVALWQKHTSVKSDFDRGFTYCADVISRFIRYRLTRFNNRAAIAGVRA